MTDDELLRLASDAACYVLSCDGMKWDEDAGEFVHWNPIDFDGDALRLACDVGLQVFPIARTESGAACSACATLAYGRLGEILTYGSDIRTATRRAIVISAAEVGMRLR